MPTKVEYRKFWKFAGQPAVPLPTSGGMLDENVIIKTPDGRSLFGLSYRGDVSGWQLYLLDRARQMTLKTATINDSDELMLDGGSVPLAGCVVTFY